MNMQELYNLVKIGYKPIIQFKNNFTNYMEESADPMMRGRIIKAYQEYNDCYTFEIDLNDFEIYNKSVALREWYDNNNMPRLTWFETDMYPENGIESVYFESHVDVNEVFIIKDNIIDNNVLMKEYNESETKLSYIEWLESTVLKLREDNMSFIQKCVNDKEDISKIDDYIDNWHNSNSDKTLYEFLGMTKEEYNLFLKSENNLIEIVNNYKNKILGE